MTQRTHGYAGGIQVGTTAYDAASLKLDSLVKEQGKSIGLALPSGLWLSSFSAARVAEDIGALGGVGMAPDGGIFLKDDLRTPLLVVEAKKQGPVGNAIERMFKNIQISKRMGATKYLVVASGSGFFDGNSAERIARTTLGCYNDRENCKFGGHSDFLEIHRFQDSEINASTVRELIEATLISAQVANL